MSTPDTSKPSTPDTATPDTVVDTNKLVAERREKLAAIRAQGVTVFLVEQNANRALQIADRGYVLENGRCVLEDTGANLLANDAVRRAYLGG